MAKFIYEIDSNDYQLKTISPLAPDDTSQDCEFCPLRHFQGCRTYFKDLFGKDCVTHFLVKTTRKTEYNQVKISND